MTLKKKLLEPWAKLWREWQFHIIVLLIIVAVVELLLISVTLFGVHKKFYNLLSIDYNAYVEEISESQIIEFRGEAYNQMLGWDRRSGAARETKNSAGRIVHDSINAEGARTNPFSGQGSDGTATIMVFGDSFTFGAELNDDETWAYQLSTLMQTDVINFGVDAYGPDQALLKIEEKLPHYDPDIIILGIMSENINRLMSMYRPFYQPSTGVFLGFKPMLYEAPDGQISFFDNPLRKLDSRKDVISAFEISKKMDYWYQAENRPIWGFPFTLAFLRVVKYKFVDESLPANTFSRMWAMYDTPEAVRKMDFVIDYFCRLAADHDFLPVVVFIPNGHDVRSFVDNGTYSYASYLSDLRESGRMSDGKLVDVLEHEFNYERFNTKAFAAHPSPYGARVIADILFSELATEEPARLN